MENEKTTFEETELTTTEATEPAYEEETYDVPVEEEEESSNLVGTVVKVAAIGLGTVLLAKAAPKIKEGLKHFNQKRIEKKNERTKRYIVEHNLVSEVVEEAAKKDAKEEIEVDPVVDAEE